MDHTKCKSFIAFRHTIDGNTYWVNQGWTYEDTTPGLFPYGTKAEKDNANEIHESMVNNWKLKSVEMVIFNVSGSEKLNSGDKNVVKRGRKPKNKTEP
jgi:GTPase Era involved in 16S rRNA processing